jgi:hypothetical protein
MIIAYGRLLRPQVASGARLNIDGSVLGPSADQITLPFSAKICLGSICEFSSLKMNYLRN